MFVIKVEVNDQQHKELAVAAQLATLNDQPVPSAEEYLQGKIDEILGVTTAKVKETNDRNRAERLKALASEDVAAVDALLGYEPVEKGK